MTLVLLRCDSNYFCHSLMVPQSRELSSSAICEDPFHQISADDFQADIISVYQWIVCRHSYFQSYHYLNHHALRSSDVIRCCLYELIIRKFSLVPFRIKDNSSNKSSGSIRTNCSSWFYMHSSSGGHTISWHGLHSNLSTKFFGDLRNDGDDSLIRI